MRTVPLRLEFPRFLRLLRESLVQFRPSASKGANIYGPSSLDVHVCDGAFDLSHDGLLLEREEGRGSVVACWLDGVLSVCCDELLLVSKDSIHTQDPIHHTSRTKHSMHKFKLTESGYLTCRLISNSYFRITGTVPFAVIISSYSSSLRNSA